MHGLFLYDHGDLFDSEKWDFPEDNIPKYIINGHLYKANNNKNAEKLASIRDSIDVLCSNLKNNKKEIHKSTKNKEYLRGLDLFLEIHNTEHLRSRYLLSEIPAGTKFSGINKPKQRYVDYNSPKIGKDGHRRASYRDIFLDLKLSDKKLRELIIHELAHTMCNHVTFRPDDHHADFKWAESIIDRHWPN